MIRAMSLRLGVLLVFAVSSCSGSSSTNEPTTAKQKQLQAMKGSANADESGDPRWKGWRYTGTRAECFYIVGRRCFKTVKAACDTTACRGSTCDVVGGGPATVTCKRDPKPGVQPPAKTQ